MRSRSDRSTTIRCLGVLALGLVSVWLLPDRPANGQEAKARLSEDDNGPAAKYLGDAGIEKDPNVVFVEDFEQPSLEELRKRWDEVKSAQIMSLSDDTPSGSTGE